MLGWVLKQEEASAIIRRQIRLQLRNDEACQEVRVVETVILCLVRQWLGSERLHRVGYEISATALANRAQTIMTRQIPYLKSNRPLRDSSFDFVPSFSTWPVRVDRNSLFTPFWRPMARIISGTFSSESP